MSIDVKSDRTERRASYCLFQDPWWLDLTAPGEWAEAVVTNKEGVVARLPYRKTRRYGLTILTQPRLTPYAGPWFRPSNAKLANQFSERRRLTEELLSQLPRYDIFAQSLWPAFPDCLPFHWGGFQQHTGYTNWLKNLGDTKNLWSAFLDVARWEIRKAQKTLKVEESGDVDLLCDFHARTFERKAIKPPVQRAFLARVAAAAIAAGHGRISVARDEKGNVHALAFVVYDDRSAHYLIGGIDENFRGSGAPSLLVWDAIQFAGRNSALFDFEGSMNEAISRFFRGFNPEAIPIQRVYRMGRRAAFATGLYDAAAAVLARPPLRL